MKKQLTNRLQELQAEYQKGQERLNALEQETGNVKASMLRISGAIQVLEELLKTPNIGPEEVEIEDIKNGIKTKK